MKNVKAKKRLGQHFLNDKQIAFNITELLSDSTKNVVEIGPGMGMLTQFLVKKIVMLISLAILVFLNGLI